MMPPFSLEGRTALVTGSSRGIGLAIAHALGTAGATVGINSRKPDEVDEACRNLAGNGIDACSCPFDVSDGDASVAAVDRFREERGRLDILVHNAGHVVRTPLAEHGNEEWQRILDVHLSAGFRLSQAAAQHMTARGRGRIIFISSILASTGRATVPAYSAAKGGMNALVRSMAAELGGSGITVNAIAPGYIVTDLTRSLRAGAFSDFVRQQTPLGRWGEPEEIGWAALYLASDAAAYVNGHVLTVDGGMTVSL